MTARRKACRHKRVYIYPLDGLWGVRATVRWCILCGALRTPNGYWRYHGAGYEASLRRALRRKQRKEKA